MDSTKPTNLPIFSAAIILLGVICVLPIFFFGIPDTVDAPQHLKFADVYYQAIQEGNYFPSFSDKENFGYGGIGHRFYPPLDYYFLAVLRIITGNFFTAAWLSFIFWMTLGFFGVYYWTRNWFPPKESFYAACIYAIIPGHLGHLYNSFNTYSEFAAASILTFCFAFLTRIFTRGRWLDVLGLACFYALLVLAHLPLAIIGSICLAIYTLLLWRKKYGWQPLLKCCVAAICGLAASSFYWFAMLTEMKWLRHASEQYNSGAFNYQTAFFPASYYFTHSENPGWIVDVTTVLTALFLASSTFYFLYKRRNINEPDTNETIFRAVLPLGLFALFMITPLSSFVWKIVTPLQKIQFPVRWLPVTAMCGSVVAAASIHYLRKGDFLKKRIWIYTTFSAIFIVLFFNMIYVIHPTAFVPLSREKFEQNVLAPPESQSFHFWWANWSNSKAFEIKDKILAENRTSKIVEWTAENRVFEISEGKAENVRIAIFYYPHWQATVNEKAVTIEKDENGAILIPVPAEKSTVKLYFQEPLTVRISSIISLLTWFLLGGLILFSVVKKNFFDK